MDWEGGWWEVLSSWTCGLERCYALSAACCGERKNQAAYRWAVIAHARYPLLRWRDHVLGHEIRCGIVGGSRSNAL